jgi:hypothetical protein
MDIRHGYIRAIICSSANTTSNCPPDWIYPEAATGGQEIIEKFSSRLKICRQQMKIA